MNQMSGSDPNRILNECSAINRALEELDARQERLKQMQDAFARDTNVGPESQSRKDLNAESDDLISQYRQLVQRTKKLKQDKDSGSPRNAPQVGRVDREVKKSMTKYQQLDRQFRKDIEAGMERQYKIVNPDATDAEVREAVQDPNQQVFTQALLNSNRRTEASSTAANVRTRHNAIQKIAADMQELNGLFQDLDALVVQQEAAVTSIEARGEEVTDHVTKANVELDGAVKKARAARKKKWICLGIAGESFPILCLASSISFNEPRLVSVLHF